MLRRRRLADAARARGRRSSRSPASTRDAIEFRHYVRMQYFGQLNDLEIYSPHQSLERGRARRRPDRRLRGRLRQALRALGPLARARLPDHERDRRPARCRSRSRRCRTSAEAAGAPPTPKASRGRSGGSDGCSRHADLRAGRRPRRPARSRARRSSSRPPTRFAIPPGRAATLDAQPHLPPRAPAELEAEQMAIVDRTASSSRSPQRRAPIGWDGRSALEMLDESERLFAETGRYWGVERARAQGERADPLREAVLAPARRPGHRPRDRAQHLGLARSSRRSASCASRSTRPRATRSRSRPGSSSTSTRCRTRSST